MGGFKMAAIANTVIDATSDSKDLKEIQEFDQTIKAKQDDLTIDAIALTLNQKPYSITCRPINGLSISKDDSNCIDIYAYPIDKLETDTLLKDTIDYFIATQGKVRERRICLLIPDETKLTAAYIFDLMEPNYIAIHLIKHLLQVLSLKPEKVHELLTQDKKIDEQTKKVLKSLFDAFRQSGKSILSFMLSNPSVLNCFASLYNKVDFKYLGSNIITLQSQKITAEALRKISKSSPFNPTYSEPRLKNAFLQTFVERVVSVLVFGNENIEKFCQDELYVCNQNLKEQPSILNKLVYIQQSEKIFQHLTLFPNLNNYDANKTSNSMSFSFMFQFLSNRKKPAQFLEWIDNTFKAHIEKLEQLIIEFTKKIKINTQNEGEIIHKIKNIIALFPILNLKHKSIKLSIGLSFYLDFLLCAEELNKIHSLTNQTLKKMEPYIKVDFLAFFKNPIILNLTSQEYLISKAVASFIRHQIIACLRKDNYGLTINNN